MIECQSWLDDRLRAEALQGINVKRFYYTFCEMDDDSFEFVVFDRRRGDNFLALCPNNESAEKIIDALNAAEKPVDLGVFG